MNKNKVAIPQIEEQWKRIEGLSKEDFISYQQGLAKKPYPTRIVCGCGNIRPIRFLYRCLYCGEYYCYQCAEVHFGKTVKQYNEEKESMVDVE